MMDNVENHYQNITYKAHKPNIPPKPNISVARVYSALSEVNPVRKNQTMKSKEQQNTRFDFLQSARVRQRENSKDNKEIPRNNENNFQYQKLSPKGDDQNSSTYSFKNVRNLQDHGRRGTDSTPDNHCNSAREKQRYLTNHNRSLFERLLSETSSVKCVENIPIKNMTPHFTSKHTQFFPDSGDNNGNYNTPQYQG